MLTVVGPSELDSQLSPLPADRPPLRSTFTAQPAAGRIGG